LRAISAANAVEESAFRYEASGSRRRYGSLVDLFRSPLVYLHPAMKVIVIIPAAGLGTRMAPVAVATQGKKKAPPSKQFTELGGTPILIHTLRKFAAVDAVNEIWIALRENEIAGFRERLEKEAKDLFQKKIELVIGGEHRQQSVGSALNVVKAAPSDVVLVHDAVRPFVSGEIIQEVIDAAQKYGAAIAGLPAVDTVKQVDRTADGALIKATIPRAAVVLAQTPQGFRYNVIKKAFDEASADGFLGTDESSLVERSGHEVAVVMGSPRNMKITTPGDMELAEFYLETADRR
jgi:2-C-methyl-D-erythritol 4-phosphate cytidylyltransferase